MTEHTAAILTLAEAAPARPFLVNTFTLADGSELTLLIERRGDPIKLLVGGLTKTLGPGQAIAFGKAATAAGHAAIVEKRRKQARPIDDETPPQIGEGF